MTRFVLTGGGTLGSVTPLLAVAEELTVQSPGAEFLWLGTKDGPERALVEKAGIKFVAITAGKWRRSLTARNLATPFLVGRGLMDAWRLLRKWRPQAVVSAGGFVAVPVVWAAWLRHIPVHIHQMDWQPGLANRLSAPFARSLSVTFEKSKNDFTARRVTATGNPIRRFLFTGSVERARRTFDLQAHQPVVLVLGGGTGALNLNQLLVAALPGLSPEVQVLHFTGRDKAVTVPAARCTYRPVDFVVEEIADAYAVADLVVTRAGMGTLTELAALGLPAIVVPIVGSHQEENAAFFARSGGAEYFAAERRGDELAKLISELLADRARLAQMSAVMRTFNDPRAAQKVAAIILSSLH